VYHLPFDYDAYIMCAHLNGHCRNLLMFADISLSNNYAIPPIILPSSNMPVHMQYYPLYMSAKAP